MSCKNKKIISGKVHTFWHDLDREHRVSVLGCAAFILLVILYSLMRAEATGANTNVQFIVTSGSSISFNLIAIPEKRIPTSGNNGTLLTVEVRNPGNTSPLYTQTITTGSGGTYSGITFTLDAGTYDITAKGYSHLRLIKTNQSLADDVTIDFTAEGASPMLSGDVNGSNGDNKVNGIDLTQIVSGLTSFDVRYDLNRDTRVNGIDLTNAVSNLNLTGAD